MIARRDPHLSARVIGREPLLYDEGADDAEDRPAFVRAASGLAWLGATLAIVQDDASFIALRKPTGSLRAVALPRGPGGRRRFEDRLGNKRDKLDLEACVAVGSKLLCFGSGALPRREHVVVMTMAADEVADLELIDASQLYRSVRGALGVDELNLEGAACAGSLLRLFHRGSGRRGGSSSVDVDLESLVRHLEGGPCPRPRQTMRYDLGMADSVPYGITDAAALDDGRMLILAAAEDSPDAIEDGDVHGALFGVLSDRDLRVTALRDESGRGCALKAEGIAAIDDGSAWVVVDPDDPDHAAELFRLELRGC